MSRPFIVIGDKTDHGGTVISADMTTDINGKFMARVDDLTVCPRCKGTFPIKTGAMDMLDDTGRAYARHLDKTACGAVLISSQATTIWSDKSSGGAGAAGSDSSSLAAASLIAEQAPSICLECLAKAADTGQAMVLRD